MNPIYSQRNALADHRTRMQLVPSASRPAPAVRPQVVQYVAESTVHAQVAYDPRELVIQRTASNNVKRVGDAITNKQAPRPIDLMVMGLLLDYRGKSPIAEEQYAENALTSLADRDFNVHSDVSHVLAEEHVRLCYAAARKLHHVHKLNDAFQRRLVRQLLVLRSYADQQDNPNVLFLLSCLRNCIVERPSDESHLHAALRYGIAIGQIAVGAAIHQPQTAAGGLRELAQHLLTARLRPNHWYREVKGIERLCHEITMARCDDNDALMEAKCQELLALTGTTLHKAIKHLRDFGVDAKRRLKDTVNALGVRQVDNEWDLAFACLDALQRNVHAFANGEQIQHVLHQVHYVISNSKLPALRYKCIELLRDLRGLQDLQPICDVLLHMAGQQGPGEVEAVAKKRRLEYILRKDALLHAQDDLVEQPAARVAPSDAPPLGIDRRGSLRMLTPRFNALPPARPTSGQLEAPAAFGVMLRQGDVQSMPPVYNDPTEKLRLALRPGEGLALACETLTDPRDAHGLKLAAMLRAGIHVTATTELPAGVARSVLGERWSQGPVPKSLLALSVAVGAHHHVRAIVTRTGQRRGFVTPAAVREAEQLGRLPRAATAAQEMRQAVANIGEQEAPAPRTLSSASERSLAGERAALGASLSRVPSYASERTLVDEPTGYGASGPRLASYPSDRTLVNEPTWQAGGPSRPPSYSSVYGPF